MLKIVLAAAGLACATAAAAQLAPPAPNAAVGTTGAGTDAVDTRGRALQLPQPGEDVGLSGSAARDAGQGKAGVADRGTQPAPQHGVELNRRGAAKSAAARPGDTLR